MDTKRDEIIKKSAGYTADFLFEVISSFWRNNLFV